MRFNLETNESMKTPNLGRYFFVPPYFRKYVHIGPSFSQGGVFRPLYAVSVPTTRPGSLDRSEGSNIDTVGQDVPFRYERTQNSEWN